MTAPKPPKRPRRQCGNRAGTDDRCTALAAKGRRWCRPCCTEKDEITQDRLDKDLAKVNAQLEKLMRRRAEMFPDA